jgi:hypothetical protein
MSKQELKKTVGAADRPSGRAVFDTDGRASWEWQTSTGVFERDVAAEIISKAAGRLSLIEHQDDGRTWPTATIPPGRVPNSALDSRPNAAMGAAERDVSLLRRWFTRLRG